MNEVAPKAEFDAKVASVRLSLLIELEREIRAAQSEAALRFVIVNRLRELVPYHQAVLLRHGNDKRFRVEAVSSVAVVQRDAPYVAWVNEIASQTYSLDNANELHAIDLSEYPEYLSLQVKELSSPCLLWCPLIDSGGQLTGALLLTRGNPWRENEKVILVPLLDCMAHAWRSYLGHWSISKLFSRRRLWFGAIAAAVVAAMFLSVPQTSLAPAEVVPYEPDTVSAPLEGVIKHVTVDPNDQLSVGELLLQYDDTKFRNAFSVATREVELAEVELQKVVQDAFSDDKSKAEQAVMEARLAKSRAELAYARDEFQKVSVRSQKPGVAVFSSPEDWIGRPVAVGQQIMLIADPERVAVDALLSVKDVLDFEPGARVQIFLDNSPLDPLEASVLRSSYDTEISQAGQVAFRVKILLDPDENIPRIGAHGVAKIYSKPVSLFFYLFRRPLTALRQAIGF